MRKKLLIRLGITDYPLLRLRNDGEADIDDSQDQKDKRKKNSGVEQELFQTALGVIATEIPSECRP